MWYSEFYSGLLDHKYISLAVQYYLLARFGSRYVFNPASGSLYHLAFELFLKSYLRKDYSQEDLKSKFGHNLVKLWSEFKEQINNDLPDKYDLIIRNLDAWERVRYIDLETGKNASAIELVSGYAPEDYLNQLKKIDYKSQKHFTLHTDDMDAFFQVLVDALKIPPEEFMKNPDFAHGRQLYDFANKHNIFNSN